MYVKRKLMASASWNKIAICFLTACVLGISFPAQALTVQSAVIDTNTQNKTVLKLFCDQPIMPRVFHLKNPPRIVLDFNTAHWKTVPLSDFIGKGGISGLRIGQFKPDVTRLVIETEKPVKNFEVKDLKTRTSQTILQISFNHPQSSGPVSILTDTPSPKPPMVLSGVQDEPLANKQAQVQAPVLPPPPKIIEPALIKEPAPIVSKSIKKEERNKYVIVLDAGHGGNDPGAVARQGKMLEKNVTLDVARLVKTYLKKDPRFKVVFTRNSDVYIPLAERVNIARGEQASLFVSLHADMFPSSNKIRGATVYTLSDKASDKEAAELAQAENKSDLIAGITLPEESYDIAGILLDLAQRETHAYSLNYADHLLKYLNAVTPLTPHPKREAGFKVLKAPDVPSVLIEMGYLSNEQDQHNLSDPTWKRQFAKAIATSIHGFFVK